MALAPALGLIEPPAPTMMPFELATKTSSTEVRAPKICEGLPELSIFNTGIAPVKATVSAEPMLKPAVPVLLMSVPLPQLMTTASPTGVQRNAQGLAIRTDRGACGGQRAGGDLALPGQRIRCWSRSQRGCLEAVLLEHEIPLIDLDVHMDRHHFGP